MRIVSGAAGGLSLRMLKGRGIRPTGDRVKESIFATLGDLTGAVVVDLFAGAGSLGLEALSRGASEVYFFESDRRHLKVIEENLGNVLRAFGDDAPKAKVHCACASRASRYLSHLEGRVDFLIADPPYYVRQGEFGAEKLAASDEIAEWAGTPVFVLEHASDVLPNWSASAWELIKEKRYGTTLVSYARKKI